MSNIDKPETLLERAKRCFKLASEAEAQQRERENADLRFQVPEMQWDDEAKKQRQGDGVVPARPIISISKLDQPIQLILNQARQAKLGVNIHPVSENSDDETAEVMQGLYNRIQRDSNADQARLWALDRAVKVGRGVYRVNTKWDEDSDPKYFDQEIVIERILDQRSVLFDPSAQRPDFSDGEYALVVAWMSKESFARKFPKAKTSNANRIEWEGFIQEAPEWVRENDVLVAEFWYKEHKTETIEFKGRKREKDVVTVKCCKLTGWEVLEEQTWDGQYIPLVPVIGRELQPFDNERYWTGMIGPSKGSQQLYNYAAATLVERMALEPKAPFIAPEGSFEGHEAEWGQANTRNYPYLEYKPTGLGGTPNPPPQRAQIDQSGMSLAMLALQEADSFIQSTTSVYDPSLGRNNPRDKSGVAIRSLQQQSDAGTSHYLASLADISMPLEARIVLDLMPKIYDRPGRVTKILGGEDETSTVMLNAPFVMDQDGKRPVQVQEGQQGAQMYDFRAGGYSVSVSIGKSFQTRLQEGGEMIGAILQSDPTLMPLVGATYFRFQDFPGSEEIADILKKVRDKQFPGLQDDQNAPTAEQAQAKAQALEQQLQQAHQMLQQAGKMIETEQVKHQAQVQQEQLKQSAAIEIARMNNATKLAVARITAAKEALDTLKEDEEEALALGMEQAHEATQNELDRQHEAGMADQAHQQAMEQGASDQTHEAAMSIADQPEPQPPAA